MSSLVLRFKLMQKVQQEGKTLHDFFFQGISYLWAGWHGVTFTIQGVIPETWVDNGLILVFRQKTSFDGLFLRRCLPGPLSLAGSDSLKGLNLPLSLHQGLNNMFVQSSRPSLSLFRHLCQAVQSRRIIAFSVNSSFDKADFIRFLARLQKRTDCHLLPMAIIGCDNIFPNDGTIPKIGQIEIRLAPEAEGLGKEKYIATALNSLEEDVYHLPDKDEQDEESAQ